NAPDLLIEIVVVDRETPPEAKTKLIRCERSDFRFRKQLESRKHAGRCGEEKIDDAGENQTYSQVLRKRSINRSSWTKVCISRAVTVPIVEPHESGVLNIMKDRHQNGDEQEILIRPLRPRVCRLVPRDEKINDAI